MSEGRILTLEEYLNGLSKEVLIEEYKALYAHVANLEREMLRQDEDGAKLSDIVVTLTVGRELLLDELAKASLFRRGRAIREGRERSRSSAEMLYKSFGITRDEAFEYVNNAALEARVQKAFADIFGP